MEHVKEPYYFESSNTSVKSFTLPLIPKANSFKSSASRRGSVKDSIKPKLSNVDSTSSVCALSERSKSNVSGLSLFRSNSLEPYFKPHITLSYDIHDCAIFDDEDEFDNTDDEILSFKPVRTLPPVKHANVRDDYDNNTKFDFYI